MSMTTRRWSTSTPIPTMMDTICTRMQPYQWDNTVICIVMRHCDMLIRMCRMHTTCIRIERFFDRLRMDFG